MEIWTASRWRAAQARHEAAVEQRVEAHLARRHDRLKHPVEDFMFTYYRLRPGALRRWHPGLRVGLELEPGEANSERRQWRWYTESDGVTHLDLAAFLADRRPQVELIAKIIAGTLSRPASFSCFGLHEWAMVYRLPEGAQRHEAYPLRLGAQGTDEVVSSHQLTCTHFDAFRFFTPEAVPRNAGQPTRALAPELEQPGCLHATMDLYKHAYSLGPAVSGDLLLACFDLAREVRTLDMQASPYDLADLGYEPIKIETTTGKADYARRQREFSLRAEPLRTALLEITGRLLSTPKG